MISRPIALAAVIATITALAFWLEARYTWARNVGAALVVIVLGAVLSNLGLVPTASPIYDGIFGPVTSLAIAWLLLAVRLSDLREAGPRMLGLPISFSRSVRSVHVPEQSRCSHLRFRD